MQNKVVFCYSVNLEVHYGVGVQQKSHVKDAFGTVLLACSLTFTICCTLFLVDWGAGCWLCGFLVFLTLHILKQKILQQHVFVLQISSYVTSTKVAISNLNLFFLLVAVHKS